MNTQTREQLRSSITLNTVEYVIKALNLDMSCEVFTPDDLLMGIRVELLEHGHGDVVTNIINGCPIKAAQIALAHLREHPHYYRYLERMEEIMDKTKIAKTNCKNPNGTPIEDLASQRTSRNNIEQPVNRSPAKMYRLNMNRLKDIIRID